MFLKSIPEITVKFGGKRRMKKLKAILIWLVSESNLDKAWEQAQGGLSFYRRGWQWYVILNPHILTTNDNTGTITPTAYFKVNLESTKRKEDLE